MNQQLAPGIIDGFNEALLAVALRTVVKHSPLGTRAVKSEVDELAGWLNLCLCDFANVGRKPKRTTSSVIRLIAFSAHGLNRSSEKSFAGFKCCDRMPES